MEWVAISSSRGASRPGDRTHVYASPALAGGFFTTEPPPIGILAQIPGAHRCRPAEPSADGDALSALSSVGDTSHTANEHLMGSVHRGPEPPIFPGVSVNGQGGASGRHAAR